MYRLHEALDDRREYERNHEFYLCEICSIRFEFGEAMDFGFECPECGSPLESMDNDRLVNAMDDRLASLSRTNLTWTPNGRTRNQAVRRGRRPRALAGSRCGRWSITKSENSTSSSKSGSVTTTSRR